MVASQYSFPENNGLLIDERFGATDRMMADYLVRFQDGDVSFGKTWLRAGS
jgi:hypothetical protein